MVPGPWFKALNPWAAGRFSLLHRDDRRAGRARRSFPAHGGLRLRNRRAQKEKQCSDFKHPGGELERIGAISAAGVGMQKCRNGEAPSLPLHVLH